jgi:hypothetical protein
MRILLTALTIFFAASTLTAQAPSADWQTIETAHFRIHYPREYESWTRRVAARLESVREHVAAQVGYAPETITDVVVENPYALANGETLPLLDTPRIVLYAEPPGPGGELGEYSDWIDLLTVHETAHLVHLLWPSRNPFQRQVARLLPLNTITLAAPRWVLEGYATVIEGRITGSGRPSSTIRAAILRTWATAGRLPTYEQLDSDPRFLGMSMAYLIGSAYLQWLEEHAGAGSLQRLWRRMTARETRGFDAAFEGVYGDSPSRLYGRFTAELTQRAMTAEATLQTCLREGQLWQETTRGSGDPAVSPTGHRLAIVLRSTHKPSRLVIWSTDPDSEQESRRSAHIETMLARDPEDVAPLRNRPLPRKPLYAFVAPDGGDIETPRWLPGTETLLFGHRSIDARGFYHHDLFIWMPSDPSHRRVTTGADVHDADPFPDGRHAVAVRSRFGATQLVNVDLVDGSVTPIDEASVDDIRSHPRVSADGARIAYAMHREGVWRIVVRDLASGREHLFAMPPGTSVASPEWNPNAPGELVASAMRGGFIDLVRIDTTRADASLVPLTRTRGGAFAPAPSPDGSIFFMSLQPDGFVVRRLPRDPAETALAPQPLDATLAPAVAPDAVAGESLRNDPVPAAHPYDSGRQERQWLAGGTASPSLDSLEAALRIGDVIGRLDTVIAASTGGVRGGSVAVAWRRWPVTLQAQLFSATEQAARAFAATRDSGLELRGRSEHLGRLVSFDADAGLFASRLHGELGEADKRQFVFIRSGVRLRQLIGTSLHFVEEARTSAERGRIDVSNGWHWDASVRATAGSDTFTTSVEYEQAGATGGSLIEVGGIRPTIIPEAAWSLRRLDAALPFASLSGDRYEGLRIEVRTPLLPVRLFFQRHSTDLLSVQHLSIYGFEYRTSLDPLPLLKLPGIDITAGAARVHYEDRHDATNFWLALAYRP